MSGVQAFVHTVNIDKNEAQRIASQTASDLEARRASLIEVIESLGKYVQNEDGAIRSKAIQFLAQVLASLPPTFLSRQQLAVITQFLCERIEDAGAIAGIRTLQTLPRFGDDLAALTVRAMLSQLQSLQTRPQNERFQAFDLLHDLMRNFRLALQRLGPEAIEGFVGMYRGEKDPRNLMVIFSIMHVVIAEWDVQAHAETVFESIFCYFPITFRPPPDDPYGITSQHLKLRLRDCIAASSNIGPLVLPQLFAKLDSGSPGVKKDVLETLHTCVESYRIETISDYSVEIWDSLKYEVFNVQDEDLADESIKVLHAISKRCYSRAGEVPKDQTSGFLDSVVRDCLERLTEPQPKHTKAAYRILNTIARTTPYALNFVVKAVLPRLLLLYEDTDVLAIKLSSLEIMQGLLEAAVSHFGRTSIACQQTSTFNPMTRFKDELLMIFDNALAAIIANSTASRIICVDCLSKMCLIQETLDDAEINMVIDGFENIALGVEAELLPDLRAAAVRGLVQIAEVKPSLVIERTVPRLLSKLSKDGGAVNNIVILNVLACVGAVQTLTDTLVRRLYGYLEDAVTQDAPLEYCEAITSTLYLLMAQSSPTKMRRLEDYWPKMRQILQIASNDYVAEHLRNTVDAKLLDSLGTLTGLVVQNTSRDLQEHIALQIFSLFTTNNLFICSTDVRQPSLRRRLSVILTTHILKALEPTIELPVSRGQIPGLVQQLVQLIQNEDSAVIERFLLEMLAILVKVFLDKPNLSIVFEMVYDSSSGLFATASSARTIRAGLSICRALALRSFRLDDVLNIMLGLLSSETWGSEGIKGFEMLLSPRGMLTQVYRGSIKPLVKQRIFEYCLPILHEQIRVIQTTMKANHLKALCGLVEEVDTSIIKLHSALLIPLLLQTLDLEDAGPRSVAIIAISKLMGSDKAIIEQHVSSLLSRLIVSSSYSKESSRKTRSEALECLRAFPSSLSELSLLPHAQSVDRGLRVALDDPKRAVRKLAVDCRVAWSKLGDSDD